MRLLQGPMTLCVAMCLLAHVLAGTARAAVSYSFSTDAAVYNGTSGTVQVNVYLTETLTGGSTSLIGDDGLSGAAFRVQRVSGTGFAVSDLLFNPAFDGGPAFNVKTVTPPATGSLTTASSFSHGVSFDAPGSGRVLLGTVVIGPGVGTADTTFAIDLYDANVGNVVTFGDSFTALDDPSATAFTPLHGGQTFVVAVPEPGRGLAMASLVALVPRRRRS